MRRRIGMLALIGALLIAPGQDTWAFERSPCQPEQVPQLLPGFAALKAQLGSTMGEPAECEHINSGTGDTVQRTTTGFAFQRRGSGPPTFTNGREFWALTAGGIEHWKGNGHTSFDPPGAATTPSPEPDAELAPLAGTYWSAEAVTIVDAPDRAGNAVIVSRQGSLYRVETSGGRPGASGTVGKTVFVLSAGPFGGPGARLIPTLGGSECLVASSRPL